MFSPLMKQNLCSNVTRDLKIFMKISVAVVMKNCQGDVRKRFGTRSKSHPELRYPRAVYRSQAGPILRSLVPLRCGARVKPQGPSLPHLEHTAGDLTWDLDRSSAEGGNKQDSLTTSSVLPFLSNRWSSRRPKVPSESWCLSAIQDGLPMASLRTRGCRGERRVVCVVCGVFAWRQRGVRVHPGHPQRGVTG
ncbi:hypothetical protein E2C01_067215 [Portunus trituberculatus]|uniref:Uncharacterized protein n=1 Tax=Portunus trituberculatus TaxID=210409 RepID=A0A5B7HNJ0_PORTR|nr:hypothetical protein [Portunus trituberculatus]